MDEIQTSGSTGEPFKFYADKAYGEIVGLNCLRSKFIHGMKPGDRILRLGGNVTNLAPPTNVLKRMFLRKAGLSSFERPNKVLEFYNRFRPNILRGFISSLYVFALWIEEQGIRLKHVPRFILCSAETVHDFMKEKVSEVFRTRVIDRYATTELGVVADNCDDGTGYHVFEDSVYAEFIELNGETYFVGTCLDNFATPFIRYNTGDICEPWPDRPGRCSCGQNTIKFKRIKGRDNDFIQTPDGSLLAPLCFAYFMRQKYDLVKKYRFIQTDSRTIQVDIVPCPCFDQQATQQIIADLKVLTRGLEPTLRIIDHIAPDPSGKMRIVASHVTGPSSACALKN
jgi:phenylacetate-CoA ligase